MAIKFRQEYKMGDAQTGDQIRASDLFNGSTSAVLNIATVNASSGTGIGISGGIVAAAGKTIKIRGFYISATVKTMVYVRIGQINGINIPETTIREFVKEGTYFKKEWQISGGRQILYSAMKVDAIDIADSGNPTETTVTITPDIEVLPHNFLEAAYTWRGIGDSIMNSTGASRTATFYPYLALQQLREDHAVSMMFEPKGFSGTTTLDWLPLMKENFFTFAKDSMILFALGVNDALASRSVEDYIANMRQLAKWSLNNPDNRKQICILQGPTPLNNATAEGFAAQYRAALFDLKAELDNERLFVIDQTTAFNPLSLGNYLNADGVHPNDTAQAGIASVWADFWTANPALIAYFKPKPIITTIAA